MKTHTFNIDTTSFGELSTEELTDIFLDGRFISPFLERHIPIWFPHLTHIKGNKPYDHIDQDDNKYDAKNFTKNGLQFMPSGMIGTGRKYDKVVCLKKIQKYDMIYILCDITGFPEIRIVFAKGEDLLNIYGNARIPYKDRVEIFG